MVKKVKVAAKTKQEAMKEAKKKRYTGRDGPYVEYIKPVPLSAKPMPNTKGAYIVEVRPSRRPQDTKRRRASM